jgi:GNAT superfamily N-acetyltransferase
MFEVKTASLTDIPLIRELNLQVWPQTYAAILSPAQIDYMLEMMYSEASLKKQMTEDGCLFVIIYNEDRPVGFASFAKEENTTWKLHKIYVLPDQQGKGTGKFLLNYIIDEIKKAGGTSLLLQVNRYNKAREFYERLGFSVIKIADFDIGNGYFMNDYVMERKL